MILSMSITGLGVIDRTGLEFGEGLTVLTGETGAGKTMVLTSLGLLLGSRADASVVRRGSDRAVVDGVFVVDETVAEQVRELGGVVEEGELIVSRSVAAQGRSRAHAGGRPVPAATLAEVVGSLVTVHGQAEQLTLRSAHRQRETLDAFGGAELAAVNGEYRQAWEAAVSAKRRLDASRTDEVGRRAEIEVLTSVLATLDELDLHPGEEDELLAETTRLTNVEDLRTHVGGARALLVGDEDTDGATGLARRAVDELRAAHRFDATLEDQGRRLVAACLELEAVADDLEAHLGALEADPARLAALHQRRASIKDLLKGRASDVAELLDWAEGARRRLADLTSLELDPDLLEEELHRAQDRVREVGARLSAARARAGEALATAVTEELHGLAMPAATFHVVLTSRKPGPHGLEDITLALQPHPDVEPRPLGQGASGGELSRVMLALEVVLGEHGGGGETFVFDEVDAGIGGHTAVEVGRRLARLAAGRQVIVVTHLAQVAAFASTHLVVEKDGATTTVRSVNGEERLVELMRMMGADADSEAARRHAEELLDAARV